MQNERPAGFPFISLAQLAAIAMTGASFLASAADPETYAERFPGYKPAHTVIKCPYLPADQQEVPTCHGKRATCVGTPGRDLILGSDADDVIVAGDGDDVVHGDLGHDIICGGEGNDSLFGAKGNDVIYGGPGDDWLFGAVGVDELYGGPGDDVLWVDRDMTNCPAARGRTMCACCSGRWARLTPVAKQSTRPRDMTTTRIPSQVS
jgi:hypothetical protein